MAIDVSPVISALTDAGVAVAAVGGAVLLVLVGIKCFRYLGLVIGGSSASSGRDWTVEGSDGHVYMQGLNEDGTVWEQDMGPK
jgi:hypothetical protein